MEIKTLNVGVLQTNCYILKIDNECLVIDPGDDFETINSIISNYILKGILLTHRHPDHIGALGKIVNLYNVVVYDKNILEEGEFEIGKFKFNVIYTPGHTDDSISFFFEEGKILFTGDFLFKESIGRTDLPGGNPKKMGKSIHKIKQFNDAINIYPGHGSFTNLGYEKRNNPFMN